MAHEPYRVSPYGHYIISHVAVSSRLGKHLVVESLRRQSLSLVEYLRHSESRAFIKETVERTAFGNLVSIHYCRNKQVSLPVAQSVLPRPAEHYMTVLISSGNQFAIRRKNVHAICADTAEMHSPPVQQDRGIHHVGTDPFGYRLQHNPPFLERYQTV